MLLLSAITNLYSLKNIFYLYWNFILTYFLTTFYANSNDQEEKLKQIEKELEKNNIIEKTLRKKQKNRFGY